jgi:2-methylcitrate dehydratase PrpD
MSSTRTLVEELWRWRREEPGGHDVRAVRQLLLDHIACAAFGSRVPAGAMFREHVLGDLPVASAPTMPIIGRHERASAVHAAMANAVAAACYEFDDTHTAGSLHPGSVVFPAAMAAATIARCDRRTFTWSVVIGYEVMCRVGRALNPHAHRARHFHPTATAGHFGAAAAAAACLDLGVDATVAALGLAGTAAGGNMQFVEEGGLTKQIHPAFAIQRGVTGAQLAARGFPGVADPIGGRRALLASQSGDPRPERLLAGLGTDRHEIRNTGIKPYPSCRNTQGPLDALLSLIDGDALTADTVRSVTFGLIEPAIPTVFEPAHRKRRPSSLAEAQFSMPYVAAVALADGTVGVEQFSPERIADPTLRALMDVVSCVHDPELDARYPQRWPAWVEVLTDDGQRLRAAVEHPRGDPENPLDDADVERKLVDLTTGIFDDRERRRVLEQAAELTGASPLDDLIDATATRRAPTG